MEPLDPPKQWLVPYFVFFQLHAGHTDPSRFVNIRVIHNKKPELDPTTGRTKKADITETLFNENIPISEIKSRWMGLDENGQPTRMSLYQQLVNYNLSATKPGNIYFGVNPRTVPVGNKKEHVEGFVSFYLDMDSHRGYTKEQRWTQIQFMIDYGLAPTLATDSGNGYHAYWVLERMYAAAEGERILKNMIALADCNAGGHVHNVDRVLRLPGFYNVKEWYNGLKPVAGVVWPSNFMEAIENKIILPRYDAEMFKHFPPCGLKDMADYRKKAITIHPYEDAEFTRIMREIVQEHGRLSREQQARLTSNEIQTDRAAIPAEKKAAYWQPTLQIIPPVEDIKWPKGKSWMKKYCKSGFDGLTVEDITKIEVAYDVQPGTFSASELDAKIIYTLITLGYTQEAVREFWINPEYKLYRPDKEKRSPMYFAETYSGMLDAAQNAFTSGEASIKQARRSLDPINVENFKTYVRRGGADEMDLMMNGEFILRGIFEDLDCSEAKNQEFYDIEARVADPTKTDGFRSYPLLIPRTAFNGTSTFKEHCYDRVTLTTDKPSNLHRLLNFLLERYANVERRQFHTKITYKDGKFIFPNYTIYADKIESSSALNGNKEIQKKFFAQDWINPDIVELSKVQNLVKQKWSTLLNIHLPTVVLSMLGLIGASAMRPRFEKEAKIQDFHLPTLNIRGDSHTGKSETAILLSSLTGINRKKNVISTVSSQFAIHRMIHMSNFVPIIIDEFKEEDGAQQNIQMVRNLVRRAYTGEAMIKGRADLSVDVTHIHGALTVIGESDLERIGNIAEISRIFPVYTSNFSTGVHFPTFLEASREDWTIVGPYFYKFVLGLDVQKEWVAFNRTKTRVLELIGTYFGEEKLRVAHNVSTLIYGATLWDQFIQSIVPNAARTLFVGDTAMRTLCTWICEWSLASGQTLHIKDEKETPDHLIPGVPLVGPGLAIARNEILDFVAVLNEIISLRKQAFTQMDNNLIPIFQVNETDGHLLINLSAAYSIYTDQMLTLRKVPIHKARLENQIRTALLRKSPWVHSYGPNRIKEAVQHCLVLNLSLMRSFGLWDSQKGEAGKTPGGPETSSTTNRISKWIN